MGDRTDIAGGYGRGMLLLAFANAIYIASAYVITMVVARMLEPGDFGVYGIITGWVSILTALLVRGLTAGISREMAEASDVDPVTAWRAGLALGVRASTAFTVVGLVLSPLVATLTDVSDHVVLVAVCSIAACTFGLNAVLLSWQMGRHHYARQAWAQIAYAAARTALVVGGAWAWGIPGAAIGYVLAPAVSSLALLARWPRATSDVAPVMRRMAREFLPIGVVSITVTAFFIVDVFAMSAAGAPRVDVGIYVAFAALAHVPFYLLQAASATMVPAIAAAGDDHARSLAIRRTMTDTLVLLAGPTFVLMAAGDATARLIFGADYDTTSPIVAPLALATAGIAVTAGLVAIAVALKRLRVAMLLTSLGVVALAAGCAAAAAWADVDVPTYVALAACGACLLTALVLGIDATRHYGRLLDVRRSAHALAVAGAAAVPPLFVAEDAQRMLVGIACGVLWLAAVLKLGLVDVRRASAGR